MLWPIKLNSFYIKMTILCTSLLRIPCGHRPATASNTSTFKPFNQGFNNNLFGTVICTINLCTCLHFLFPTFFNEVIDAFSFGWLNLDKLIILFDTSLSPSLLLSSLIPSPHNLIYFVIFDFMISLLFFFSLKIFSQHFVQSTHTDFLMVMVAVAFLSNINYI